MRTRRRRYVPFDQGVDRDTKNQAKARDLSQQKSRPTHRAANGELNRRGSVEALLTVGAYDAGQGKGKPTAGNNKEGAEKKLPPGFRGEDA